MIEWRNVLLGIAIIILTIFVGVYGIGTFYGKAPEYDKFCPNSPMNNPQECKNLNGTWVNYTQEMNGKPVPVEPGYCQYDYTKCQKELETAEEKYYKVVFMIAIPLGILIIAAGLLIFHLAPVGIGLMGGGIGIILYGAGNYWRFSSEVIKFVLSAIGLVALIILAYYFNKRFHWKLFGKKTDNKKSSNLS